MEIYIRNFMICAERNLDVRLHLEIYEKWINHAALDKRNAKSCAP